jgi:hypothetical protein
MISLFLLGLVCGVIITVGVRVWQPRWGRTDLQDGSSSMIEPDPDETLPILISKKFTNASEDVNSETISKANVVGHSMVSSLVNAGILRPKTLEGWTADPAATAAASAIPNPNAYKPDASVSGSTTTISNVFLPKVLKLIKSPDHFVGFSGRNVKSIWGAGGTEAAAFELNGKTKAKDWGDVAQLMKEVLSKSTEAHYWNSTGVVRALHIHNEHKLGDLLELIIFKHLKDHGRQSLKDRVMTEPELHRVLDLAPVPMVLTNTVDENWGFLSTGIGTRTAHWLNLTNHLRIHRADYSTVQHLLSSEKTLLLQTNGHVDPAIGFHPKIISVPLGIRNKVEVFKLLHLLGRLPPHLISKNKWLVINNSGWGDRTGINELVSLAFNRTVTNSYTGVLNKHLPKKSKVGGKARRRKLDQQEGAMAPSEYNSVPKHVMETVRSRFVLCPSGLSMDSYRLWETLVLGAIPIIESNLGMDRMFSHLPVLVVANYAQLTPQLLYHMYPCFIENLEKWRFQHLTQEYWLSLIRTVTERGDRQHVMENHPKDHICIPPATAAIPPLLQPFSNNS